MGLLVVAILFISAIYLTMYRGAVFTFVTLYLPALLLISTTPKISLPGLPDMNATYGIVYGILGGLVLKGGESFPFRWGWMDTLMILLALSTVITGMATEYLWTGASILGEQFLAYLAPYFLARVMFHSAEMRRRALWMCVGSALIIGFFALIELRLYPYFLSRTLKSFGLFTGQNTMVLMRFGLFRTQGTFDHPIDMGNACLILTALIAIFALTTSVGLKDTWVRLGLCAAFGSSLSSLSFTSYMGILSACAMLVALCILPALQRIPLIFVIAMFIGGIVATYTLKNTDVVREDVGQSMQDSMMVRAMIVQNSWPFAEKAGFFGFGNKIKHSDLNLESVDNSYMLFTMRRGFVYLGLFLSIPVFLTIRAGRAFGRMVSTVQRGPLIVSLSATLGTMVAMYTVWFGFAYSVLWIILLGLSTSMMDVLMYGSPAAQLIRPAGRGIYTPRGIPAVGGA